MKKKLGGPDTNNIDQGQNWFKVEPAPIGQEGLVLRTGSLTPKNALSFTP